MNRGDTMTERPLGITIISIFGFIGALLLILPSIFMLASNAPLSAFESSSLDSLSGVFGSAETRLLGFIVLIIGVIAFLISFGLWKLKKWAWTVVLIFESLVIVFNFLAINIIGIIIPIIVVWYLWKKKGLFA